MNIAITGASGFIGRHLAASLVAQNHAVRSVSLRSAPRPEDFAGCDAVIHLAGEPVAQRWSAQSRDQIRASRVDVTRRLVETLSLDPPSVLISASAIGYYGSRGDEILTESSSPSDDFLGSLAVEWERESRASEAFGVRVVNPRISVVLGRNGGALQKMLIPFQLGIGGRIGDGSQWMSWIHLDDLTALISFALENESLSGPVNASSPNPVTNTGFTRELARAIHRPAIFPVPKFVLKALYGEMAQIVYASQRVIPQAAINAGFSFRFANLASALANLL